MGSETSPYAVRYHAGLDQAGGYYSRHVDAMTRFGLHSKSDIAGELAWRDYRIAELERALSTHLAQKDAKRPDAAVELVDREVRRCRRFYFQHNPPSTMLAQIFNDILIANGTFESDMGKNLAREVASRAPAEEGIADG